ncbi:hypothetical protein [Amycolatopsis sp. NPDC049868]|uniref:hypothetical protein n=1 Tax=Amycolatopsis sp. NPDC049868 TaxID=3363934 RepID=UPI0037A66A5D
MAIIAERPVVPVEPAAAKPTLRDAGLAALAPASWGTVYVVTATLLPRIGRCWPPRCGRFRPDCSCWH